MTRRIFRGNIRLQLQCVENAARCALQILKLGMLDNFGKLFTYLYPLYDGKIHEELGFFSLDDLLTIDSQTGTDQVRSLQSVPPVVTAYIGSLLSLGLLEHMIQAVELPSSSGSSVQDVLLGHLFRLTFILPHSGVLQVRDCLLRFLNDFVVSDSGDLRKFDKDIVRTVFRQAVYLDKQLNALSVNVASSDDHQHELAYLDFILKLNNCVEFQDPSAVELFVLPLLQSLRSTKKCYAILAHFFLKVCETSFFKTLWFQPIADSNLKKNPTLQPLFTDLLSKVVSSMNECDCSRSLQMKWRIIETFLASSSIFMAIYLSNCSFTFPKKIRVILSQSLPH